MSETLPQRHQTKTVVAGVIGNVLEWYDFALFGFLAPIIGPLFFPSDNKLASLLDTYGVFALGFLMRPVGGVLFGHIGDRIGRKQALLWSVLLMAVPTTTIAFLPTYSQIGLAAPILLTLIRMLQGISVGGEFIGSMSFLGEHSPPGRRGFIGSWCTFSGGLGNLMGSGAAALATTLLSPDDLRDWGWRVPFLGGLGVGVVGLWLRSGIAESKTFEDARKHGDTAKVPLLVAFRENKAAMLITVGIASMLGVGFYLPWVWLPTWLADINTPRLRLSEALTVNTIAMSVMIALTPAGGWLSDVLGRKRVLVAGSVAVALLTYPLFLLLREGTATAALQAQLILAACSAMVYGPASAAFVELFPTKTRYSGIAFAYNGSQALLGGTTPLVATFLIEQTGAAIAPAFYLIAAAMSCVVAAMCMRDRTGEPLG
jgi:MFS transporter, MHS family, proline/betaine transporter